MFNKFRPKSQPINISQSHSDRYREGINRGQSESDSDNDDHNHNHSRRHRTNNSNGNQHQSGSSYRNLDSAFDNLTVGSLPDSRLQRRRMSFEQRSRHSLFAKHQPSGHGARRGESSLYRSNSNGTRFGNGRGNGTRYGNQFDGEDLSRSMPNAPFIGSHGSSEMAMSRIPDITLTEAQVSPSSSTPFGSLNERQFVGPSSLSHRINGHNNMSSSYNPHSVGQSQGQGLLDIQARVQEMRRNGALIKNDTSGLASLLGMETTEINGIGNGNGIGGGNNGQNRAGAPQSPRRRTAGGIGSAVEESFGQPQHHAQDQISHEHQHPLYIPPRTGTPHQYNRHSFIAQNSLPDSQTHTPSPINHSLSMVGVDGTTTALGVNDAGQLGTSVTGLSIMEGSPRGMLDLQPEEKKESSFARSQNANMQMRSRSFSDEGNGSSSMSINITATSTSEHKSEEEVSGNFYSFNRVRVEERSHDRERTFSNESEDSSPDDLFDLEMDM